MTGQLEAGQERKKGPCNRKTNSGQPGHVGRPGVRSGKKEKKTLVEVCENETWESILEIEMIRANGEERKKSHSHRGFHKSCAVGREPH